MSDGPFRNVALTSRWKVYGQKLVSDAASAEERMAQACHSMIRDVDMQTFHPLSANSVRMPGAPKWI